MSCKWLFLLAVTTSFWQTSFGQDNTSTLDKAVELPSRFFSMVDRKMASLEQKIIARSEKALKALEREENRLRKKLAKKDSLAAAKLFGGADNTYHRLQQELRNETGKLVQVDQYLPHLDSLKTSLQFLSQYDFPSLGGAANISELQTALNSVKALEGKLYQAEKIRKYVRERRQLLKDQLGQFGLVSDLKNFNKQVYYYSEQIKEHKAILQDPKKLEQKVISLVSKIPAFQKFMKENSQLATLFRLPDNYGSLASLEGLQTRTEIQQLIQGKIQSGGPNAQRYIQQSVQQAQGQLTRLKDKINKLGGSASDFEMPDFKPNTEKTKSFLKRLEFAADVQSVKANSLFPTTTDIGISIGYKLNGESIIGIGGSYKVGWGKDIRHIKITHEGIGIRSFIDWKLKGAFHISGGYEQNYRSGFDNIAQLIINEKSWQKSALIGLSKKYYVGKKIKGTAKLLFDCLHARQTPKTPPILFRLGYQL